MLCPIVGLKNGLLTATDLISEESAATIRATDQAARASIATRALLASARFDSP